MLIAQISDPHLRPAGTLYQGVADTAAMLRAAVAHLNAMAPRPDLVLLSGDLTDEGTAPEYAEVRAILADLAPPLLAIPGNHDDREAFRSAFADHGPLPVAGPLHVATGRHGPLRIIGVDVTIPGEHHGLLDEAGAAWLDAALAEEPGRPTLVMMHQPPLVTGVPYIDAYRCHGAERLETVLRRHPQVEAVVCGHVHRVMMRRFAGTLLVTAPSVATAIALRFEPEAPAASHLEPPAFLLHRWSGGDGLLTHVVPIGTFPGPYGFA